MVEAPIDAPEGWTPVSTTEAAGMRWHRYRYRPTETVGTGPVRRARVSAGVSGLIASGVSLPPHD